MLAETLYDGCSAVNRRIGLVFLDVFWKAVWLVLTAVLSLVLLIWIGNGLGSLTWEGPDPRTNPLVLPSLLRGLWDAYAQQAFWGLTLVLTLSAAMWLFLEAYFRSRMLQMMEWGQARVSLGTGAGVPRITFGTPAPVPAGTRGPVPIPVPSARSNFRIFLASGIARASILFATILLLGAVMLIAEDPGGIAIIAMLILAALAFLLAIAETLIRTDAVDLLATHLLEVAGLVGGLLIFEVCLSASAIVSVLIALLHASTALEFFLTFAFAALVALLLTALHSYLLLVRFFSIGIMRRDVDV